MIIKSRRHQLGLSKKPNLQIKIRKIYQKFSNYKKLVK